jgi:hypothetical protein
MNRGRGIACYAPTDRLETELCSLIFRGKINEQNKGHESAAGGCPYTSFVRLSKRDCFVISP